MEARFWLNNYDAYKVPKIVEFRNSIPKSAVGKILRKTLRDKEIARSKSKK